MITRFCVYFLSGASIVFGAAFLACAYDKKTIGWQFMVMFSIGAALIWLPVFASLLLEIKDAIKNNKK